MRPIDVVRMKNLIDCFLYNDELDLLRLRLRLLDPVVHKFVIVWATETFTGKPKHDGFPWHDKEVAALRNKIYLITSHKLIGRTVWDKEHFSRNLLAGALNVAGADDLLLISDLDEIPRPAVLRRLRANPPQGPHVLGLDYFNFKLNYQLVHGTQAVWPGPILCPVPALTTPQALRNKRWAAVENPEACTIDAGWHFSFLTAEDDVRHKLTSYPHQDSETQSRTGSIGALITARRGFHEADEPGSVWAVVADDSYGCADLTALVRRLPALRHDGPPDDPQVIRRAVKLAMVRLKHAERGKMLRWYTVRQLQAEIWRRVRRRLRGN